MQAKDIMTTQVMTVQAGTTILDAMKLLVKIEISGLVVTDENNDVVGIVTEKDLLVAYEFLKQLNAPISDFINRKVLGVTEDTPVEDISKILTQENVRRVPVIKNKKIAGVVSRRDVIRMILKENGHG